MSTKILNLKTIILALFISTTSIANAASTYAGVTRVLKFNGVPKSQAEGIAKEFPFVFEREVTLSEADEVVRYLMKTGNFSSVEIIEAVDEPNRELIISASLLRKVREIKIKGNKAISNSEILRVLDISTNQTFERKDLLSSAEELRRNYETIGFSNAKIEVEFGIPNDTEVDVFVTVSEGTPVKITDVTIDSTNSDLNKKLGRFARSLREKILTEDELRNFEQSVNSYLQENDYLTAKLSSAQQNFDKDRKNARLTYTIENPIKFVFSFTGNKYFSSSSIIREIESENLAGSISSPAPDMAEKIRRHYTETGFANAEVSYSETFEKASHRQKINFTIREGARVKIREVKISGNVSRPEKYYANIILSASSDLVKKGYYNRKDLDEGTKALIAELQNQGYLRARIQSQRAEFTKDKAGVSVQVAIDEGPLTQIRQIRLEGVDSFPKNLVIEKLKIKAGSALSLQDLEDSIADLKSFYRSEGFLEMKLLNENEQSRIVRYNETNTQATVEFQVFEGPRVIVSSISTQGNSFTKDEVILRELAFKTGDVLTPEKIEESVLRLQKLSLFSRVDIRTLEDGTNIPERTVIVNVSERDPGLFTLGFGLTNDQYLTLRGYLGIAYRNINGTGRAVSFRVDPRYSTDQQISYLEHVLTLSYLEPYIFGDRNRGRVNVSRSQTLFEKTSSSAIIQEENSIGLLADRDLTRHIKTTLTIYSFSNQRQFDRFTRENLKFQNIAKIGPLIEFDYRDDAFNPSSGSYSFANFEYSDPLLGSSNEAEQTIQFFKATASATHYKRLFQSPRWIWANSVRGGYLANLSPNTNSGVPSQEAFFLGGRSTIRGFDAGNEFERIPNRIELGVADRTEFKVTENSQYYLIKTELRFPIWGQLGGAIFYDGGAVLLSQIRLRDPYRDSVGLGLRYPTPVGPINMEIGYKLDRRVIQKGSNGNPDLIEAPWAFHFSIGAF